MDFNLNNPPLLDLQECVYDVCDTDSDLLHELMSLMKLGAMDRPAFKVLMNKYDAFYLDNKADPPVAYKPIQESTSWTSSQVKPGHLSVSHCLVALNRLKDRAMKLGILLSKNLVLFLVTVYTPHTCSSQVKNFILYVEKITKDREDLVVFQNMLKVLRSAIASCTTRLKPNITAEEMTGVLQMFEKTMWDLQNILTYPYLHNLMEFQDLQASSMAVPFQNLEKAIDLLSAQVHNATASVATSSTAQAINLHHQESLKPVIQEIWSL